MRKDEHFRACGGLLPTCCHGKIKVSAKLWRFGLVPQSLALPPLRKGSQCHAPALCTFQWRGLGTQLFTFVIRQIVVRLVMVVLFAISVGWFWWNQQKMKEFNYSNCEVLDRPMGGTNKNKNTEVFTVLPSWSDEKEEHFTTKNDRHEEWLKILNLSKNIFGKSLTVCAPSDHEKATTKRKFRDDGSLRLTDLRMWSAYLRRFATVSMNFQNLYDFAQIW